MTGSERLRKFWFSALSLKGDQNGTSQNGTPPSSTNAGSNPVSNAGSNPVHSETAESSNESQRKRTMSDTMPIEGEETSTVEDIVDEGPIPETWYHNSNPVYKVRRPLGLPMLLMSKGFRGSVSREFLATVDGVDQIQALPHDVVVQERLTMADFEICETLGSGAFASVARCTKKSTGESFAIKRLLKSEYAFRPSLEASMPRQEHDTLILSGGHPNVCSLECAFETKTCWIMVIEFCDQGSLRSLMKHEGTPGLQIVEATRLCSQVLQGLGYLHSLSILHRDVKPENVGISNKPEHKTAKLIDFGFAARVPGCQARAVFGSYGYLAPEIEVAKYVVGPLREASEEHTYDNRVDLYSFGVMLFVTMVGSEASYQGKLWAHGGFRKMLADPEYKLWTCREYLKLGISSSVMLPKLEECGAIDAVSALTETKANDRPANAAEALKLRLFVQYGPARQ